MTDLISGQVQVMFTSMPTVLAHVKAGRLRLLGTGGNRRSAVIPDTPTVAESVAGFELITWYGVFAPARTPGAIVKQLNGGIGKVLVDAESRERLGSQGLEPVVMTPEELKRYTTQDSGRWARLIKSAGIKPGQ
jgi:tripartite-type tricarboxylate transporter receptor subunit TctC